MDICKNAPTCTHLEMWIFVEKTFFAYKKKNINISIDLTVRDWKSYYEYYQKLLVANDKYIELNK